nr:ribonuclease H-like domain-containing protein [Tanacetum cinerariifolium]
PGVANVVAETAWLRNLLRELHSPLSTATLVYCDNVSAVYLSANPVQHQRTKHIEIDIHFVRDMVIFGFFMYLLATSMLISSPKVALLLLPAVCHCQTDICLKKEKKKKVIAQLFKVFNLQVILASTELFIGFQFML